MDSVANPTIGELMAALHEDYVVRVERTIAGRFPAGIAMLTAAPGSAPELALEACRSFCREPRRAFPAAAAIHAAFIAIALVDELLDEDPRADLSVGRTANLAAVSQALAFELLSEIEATARAPIAARVARMLVDTAWGQERDVTESVDDAGTWSIAAAKTVPLFGAALFCGAIAGGAADELATSLEELGAFIGRIIQIQDDLTDVFEPGNDADWRRPSSNVVLRYALHLDHPGRDRVRQLLTTAGTEGDSRDEIRRMLGTCGAFDYGMSSVLFYADAARRRLDALALDPLYLAAFLDRLTAPTRDVLASRGVDAEELSQHLVQAFGIATPAG